jgi:hypothetical protein
LITILFIPVKWAKQGSDPTEMLSTNGFRCPILSSVIDNSLFMTHTLGTQRGTSDFGEIADSLNISEDGLIDTSQVLSALLEQIGRTSKQHFDGKTRKRCCEERGLQTKEPFGGFALCCSGQPIRLAWTAVNINQEVRGTSWTGASSSEYPSA